MFLRFCFCLFSLLFLAGCKSEVESVSSSSTGQDNHQVDGVAANVKKEPVDPEEAVLAIESLNGKIRRDGAGAIIDVDLRGLDISDTDLASLPELPRLRAVRLAGTAVTDDGMKTIGKVSSLEDLDLRDCGISDDGLSHLTGLSRLKALRLSGKSGDCSVSDDGMIHVAKLPALKVLGVDFLWISEDGVQAITALKNLQELYMAETTIGNDAVDLFAEFPQLKKLRLARNQIDAEGVAKLPQLKQLEEIDLSDVALYPPGKCIQLFQNNPAYFVDATFGFNSLILAPTCVSDHRVASYVNQFGESWGNFDTNALKRRRTKKTLDYIFHRHSIWT